MWWDPNDGLRWWSIFGAALLSACWLATVGIIAWVVLRIAGDRGGRGVAPTSPQEIARERLARGEITPDEFRELRQNLG